MTICKLMDKYILLKRVTKKEYKQQFKPWITVSIRNSIKRIDHILGQYIKSNDQVKTAIAC